MENQNSQNAKNSILIIDDEPGVLQAVAVILEQHGYTTTCASGGQKGLDLFRSSHFNLVLCDLKMPHVDGMAFLKTISKEIRDCTVIMMSAYGTIDLALEAIKLGAYDYISKPFNAEELILTLKKAEERQKLQRENRALRAQIKRSFSFADIIGKSQKMESVFRIIQQVADYPTNILIQGESGTGKDLIARAIHRNSSRKNKPFIAINCGAIPEHLLESELFGHFKGSFTDATKDKRGLFLEAHQGTLFLDEIGEMPIGLQVKLLRAIQEKSILPVGASSPISVDIRIIAASLRNVEEDVLANTFRDDLFYRLNVVAITVPPLRERVEDIPLLIDHFIETHCQRLNIPVPAVSQEVLSFFLSYNWPGNVRELENSIEYCLVLGTSDEITLENLPPSLLKNTQAAGSLILPQDSVSIKEQTELLERALIRKALEQTGGNRTKAAKLLEISHRALLYKIKDYALGVLLIFNCSFSSTLFLSIGIIFGLFYATQLVAEGVYICKDENGKDYYCTSSAPASSRKPATLPPIAKENIDTSIKQLKQTIKESCKNHGGDDCSRGPDSDGSVICNDGFRASLLTFQQKCSKIKLDVLSFVLDSLDLSVGGKTETSPQPTLSGAPTRLAAKLTLRNPSSVAIADIVVKFDTERSRAIAGDGPGVIEPFGLGEYHLPLDSFFPQGAKFNEIGFTVECANCESLQQRLQQHHLKELAPAKPHPTKNKF